MPPDPQTVGLYITALASGTVAGEKKAVATIELRLASLTWNCVQRGLRLDRSDRHIATVMAGIRNRHAARSGRRRRPCRKTSSPCWRRFPAAARATAGLAPLRECRPGLRPTRRKTGAAGWKSPTRACWVTLRGKTGWREVEIGRDSANLTLSARGASNLAEVRPHRPRSAVPPCHRQGPHRRTRPLQPSGVARLVKRGDLSESERGRIFSGHSLRAGLATSAEVDERYVQKQLGHASAEMTRTYQRRRDRFRVNLTKASGL